MSASNSRSSSSTSTANTDKSITTQSGNVLALDGVTLTVGNQGAISIVNSDPATARDAIAAISAGNTNLVSAVTQLNANANAAAKEVVASQREFVATASGQKSITYAVAIVGGVIALVALPKVLQSFKK